MSEQERPIAQRPPADSLEGLLALIQADTSARTALKVAPRLAALDWAMPSGAGRAVRIALLGSSTLDQLRDCLAVACYRQGWQPRTYLGGFDQYAQEILGEGSGLYAFDPEVLILAVHASRLFGTLHEFPFDLSIEDRQAAIDDGIQGVRRLISRFRDRSRAPVILHNMVEPQHPALGIQDWRDPYGQRAIFHEINLRLSRMAKDEFADVHVLDLDLVEARCGKSRATDVRLWLAARLPWSEPMLEELTAEHLRFLTPIFGRSRKCLVLDLDGTLWGGVVGEDGVQGLKLGAEPPGSGFVLFQREILKLWKRGVLLAICSKNNEADALAAFQHHAMVLRQSHFAAQRINWRHKADNLREIAAELNIGLESLVFLDDSPAERAAVRAALPQVLCPELPTDAAYLRPMLRQLGVFETLALTEEDFRRNSMYAEESERRRFELEHEQGSIEEYLAELAIVAEAVDPSPEVLPRFAQLTQKTNQFNLTTRRYTVAEIEAIEASGGLVCGMRVADRFGDSGVVGLAIALPRGAQTWRLDVLLLSCRVIGRGLESVLLAHVVDHVRTQGGLRLEGWFIPTDRNAPARDCYRRHGFELRSETAGGEQLWDLEIAGAGLAIPDWIEFRLPLPLGS